jgi:hypothetical protein
MSQNSILCGRAAPPAGRGNAVAPREFPKRGAAAALRLNAAGSADRYNLGPSRRAAGLALFSSTPYS